MPTTRNQSTSIPGAPASRGRGRREGNVVGGASSVTEIAVTHLRRAIISGELPLGQHIAEQRLADEVGVSRSALREALRIVEGDGLVRHIPRAGTHVTTFSAADVREILDLREHLEELAISRGVPARDAPLRALEQTVIDIETHARAGVEAGASLPTLAFHRAFIALAEMPRLDAAFGVIAQQLGVIMRLNRSARAADETLLERAARHRRLYEAVAAGDPDAVRTELRAHPTESVLSTSGV